MARFATILSDEEWDEYLDREDQALLVRRTTTAVKQEEAAAAEPSDFNPTFTGSKHEREWILRYLAPFYRDQIITDVLRVVKGGKEATVYCCAAHPGTGLDLIAAKVYRPKMFRTMKNDADYKWGRPLLDGQGKAMRDKRLLKAVAQGSKAGDIASHTSWLTHEFTSLRLLHDAGANVPRPIAQDDNALLMEYVGDEHHPAPPLNDIHVPPDEAESLFETVLRDVELMLRHDRIHGDLSAYNILYWDGKVTIIDLPQVIDAYGNPDAFRFLSRDVERVCSYFQRHGVTTDAGAVARRLWERVMPEETYQIRGSRF